MHSRFGRLFQRPAATSTILRGAVAAAWVSDTQKRNLSNSNNNISKKKNVLMNPDRWLHKKLYSKDEIKQRVESLADKIATDLSNTLPEGEQVRCHVHYIKILLTSQLLLIYVYSFNFMF